MQQTFLVEPWNNAHASSVWDNLSEQHSRPQPTGTVPQNISCMCANWGGGASLGFGAGVIPCQRGTGSALPPRTTLSHSHTTPTRAIKLQSKPDPTLPYCYSGSL